MKFKIQKGSIGFNFITIAYVKNVWGCAYHKYFCVWIFNIGFVWFWDLKG